MIGVDKRQRPRVPVIGIVSNFRMTFLFLCTLGLSLTSLVCCWIAKKASGDASLLASGS